MTTGPAPRPAPRREAAGSAATRPTLSSAACTSGRGDRHPGVPRPGQGPRRAGNSRLLTIRQQLGPGSPEQGTGHEASRLRPTISPGGSRSPSAGERDDDQSRPVTDGTCQPRDIGLALQVPPQISCGTPGPHEAGRRHPAPEADHRPDASARAQEAQAARARLRRGPAAGRARDRALVVGAVMAAAPPRASPPLHQAWATDLRCSQARTGPPDSSTAYKEVRPQPLSPRSTPARRGEVGQRDRRGREGGRGQITPGRGRCSCRRNEKSTGLP
jgi:hypothetical protein